MTAFIIFDKTKIQAHRELGEHNLQKALILPKVLPSRYSCWTNLNLHFEASKV